MHQSLHEVLDLTAQMDKLTQSLSGSEFVSTPLSSKLSKAHRVPSFFQEVHQKFVLGCFNLFSLLYHNHIVFPSVSSLSSFPKDDLTPVASEGCSDNGFPSNVENYSMVHDTEKAELLKTPTGPEE